MYDNIPLILAFVFGTIALVFFLAMLTPKIRKHIVDVLVVALIGFIIYHNSSNRPPSPQPTEFAQAVNIDTLNNLAVQRDGRLKSFSSFSRTMMRFVSGRHKIGGQQAAFTYFDMMFRPDAYMNADVIYVKHKDLRAGIANQLIADAVATPDILESFRENGLIAPALLNRPSISALLDELERDLIKMNKQVNMVHTALTVSDPRTLSGNLQIIPPPNGSTQDPWFLMSDVLASAIAPTDHTHAGVGQVSRIPGLDPGLTTKIANEFNTLKTAWLAQDATAVNTATATLAALIRTVEPDLYPPVDKLQLESWYFKSYSMTWVWTVYMLALIPLLIGFVYRWRGANLLGIAIFVAAFGLHTASLAIRWHLSGRIPNSNMFEAISAATWFGGILTFILELIVRKTTMRNLFFIGSATASMTAAMCSYFLPIQLTSDINNVMPILLHNVWLYIHTNMIIASYCTIAIAAVTALLYLRDRIGGGKPDAAILGGAGSLMMPSHPSAAFVKNEGVSVAQVCDGATMIMMEFSFVTLWTGLVMGAIWADQSWGRPWGWDPKEVFALNTFIIFLLLIHVRLKVRDKGLWTAILAVVGCAVMLFNWIVINFFITGLHSYA